MKFKFILLLFAIPISIFGQSIEKIFFRGDSVFLYPIESNSMIDIELIDSLADGTYFSFFQGDTSFLRLMIHYKNNRIDGKVIEYSDYNYRIHRITEFKNGKPDGA
jgi:antitoxin component YwqK of YwqJK toxin-antitoxin module